MGPTRVPRASVRTVSISRVMRRSNAKAVTLATIATITAMTSAIVSIRDTARLCGGLVRDDDGTALQAAGA